MKSLVLAFYAQFRVGAGVKDSGRTQWHGVSDPVSVETCYCATAVAQLRLPKTAYEAGMNLHCGAQNRVLCAA